MLCETKSIIDQLLDVYYAEKTHRKATMERQFAYEYYKKLLEQGNIQVYTKEDKVLGYYEVWRINFEQFGRIICGEIFCADGEDIINGKIANVADVWIDENYRNGEVYKTLRNKFFRQNFDCDYFVGTAMRKKTQPVKVFKKSDLSGKLFKLGEL